MKEIVTAITVVFFFILKSVLASTGDRSQMFYSCLQDCLAQNCSGSSQDSQSSLILRALQWTCSDECKYFCMWPTVNWFVEAEIGVQQFYGKWPFVRIWGIQEPAATLFSILNLVGHVVMIKRFRKEVRPSAPFYRMTHYFCFICCHAWLWSTIFHIRDVRFTEIMDYLGAFSMVLFSVYHFLSRVLAFESRSFQYSLFFGIAIGFYFVYHSYTTFFVKMDYGYNMLINIAFGACAAFVALVAFTTLFEVLDFPPLFWVLDAHALWHLSTAPLAILWYKFLIDDCHHMEGQKLDLEKLA
ncbi:post-GPI attachment to proteins factor 3 isoform X2 [Daphnia magna]|uniref:post-GPI attachment to proteins factor 3 isoform X2 n=1 Tax=Daphnia magna TaxID=35525 RepID=UPI0006EAC1DD|nr:post-GPI attachment to proteins factor 3 isoform X2 [Daphnia magna]